ncbi:transcriptional activator hap3 [Vermiconidia calcicola]|uniref:Transcriptional activator hap3 n=1 Tax=Vermiconidia calcicola TaxID=1690605 RepID=A0ACC3M8J6_9PEZI|nr:transcriptional activator hap3 [Vermiconidia calcicola]
MSSPAQSPRETEDVDPTAPTPDENENEPQQQEVGEAGTMNRDDPIPGYDFEVKEQDRWLPIANVARIMKMALPENAKIAKEAKECMQECVSEFISFITSEASEKCQQEKRKTVNGEDILFAMTSLGFENYGEALKIYLARYRENLVARGDGKPAVSSGSGTGANSTTSPGYEGASHGVLSNPMDPSVEGGADFAYGHPGPGDY